MSFSRKKWFRWSSNANTTFQTRKAFAYERCTWRILWDGWKELVNLLWKLIEMWVVVHDVCFSTSVCALAWTEKDWRSKKNLTQMHDHYQDLNWTAIHLRKGKPSKIFIRSYALLNNLPQLPSIIFKIIPLLFETDHNSRQDLPQTFWGSSINKKYI